MSKLGKKEEVKPWEKLGIPVAPTGIVHGLLDLMQGALQKRTLCLVGESGIGKSPLVRQWVDSKGGYMKVFNFAHASREDMNMPMINDGGDAYGFLPAEMFLRLNHEAEEKGLAVLFIDEWNRGEEDMVNAMFTLNDERRFADIELHKDVMIVAAMNPSDQSYRVNGAERDPAVRKRLCFVYVQPDIGHWLKYVEKTGWHPLVPKFVRASPVDFYDRGARDAGKAFPCPANWEKVSDYLQSAEAQGMELNEPAVEVLVCGQIGQVTGQKFMEYVSNEDTVVSPEDVIGTYKPGSLIRKRVLRLLNKQVDPETNLVLRNEAGDAIPADPGETVATGVIGSLMKGVGITLFSEQPPVEEVAEQLSWFMADLDNTLCTAFANEHLKKAAMSHGKEGSRYYARLSHKCNDYDFYRNKMVEINAATAAYQKARKKR